MGGKGRAGENARVPRSMLLRHVPPPPAFGWRKDTPSPQAFAWQIPQASTAFHPRRLGEDFPDSGAHSDWDIVFFFPLFCFRLVGWLVGCFFFYLGVGLRGCFLFVGLGDFLLFLMLSSLVLGSRG